MTIIMDKDSIERIQELLAELGGLRDHYKARMGDVHITKQERNKAWGSTSAYVHAKHLVELALEEMK